MRQQCSQLCKSNSIATTILLQIKTIKIVKIIFKFKMKKHSQINLPPKIIATKLTSIQSKIKINVFWRLLNLNLLINKIARIFQKLPILRFKL